MMGQNVNNKIDRTVRMFRKELPLGLVEDRYIYDRGLSHAERYLDKQKVAFYRGFPVGMARKGYKAIKEFLIEDGNRDMAERRRKLEELSDTVLLDEANGYYEDIPNEFDIYLDGYVVRGEGGRAVKVFATNNNKDFYYIDMREDEFYDFLTQVGNTLEPKINEVGKLEGKFVLYREGSNLKPISVNDSRVRPPEN